MVFFPLTNPDRERREQSRDPSGLFPPSVARSVRRSRRRSLLGDEVGTQASRRLGLRRRRRPWRLMGILVQFCRSSLLLAFSPSFLAPPRPPCVRRHWRLPIFPFVKKRGEIPVDVATQPRHLLAPSARPSSHAVMCVYDVAAPPPPQPFQCN